MKLNGPGVQEPKGLGVQGFDDFSENFFFRQMPLRQQQINLWFQLLIGAILYPETKLYFE